MNRAAMIGACVLLAACSGGSQDDLRAWMDEQAKTMRGAVRPLPELRQVPIVAYAGMQGDDPDVFLLRTAQAGRVFARGACPAGHASAFCCQ